MYCYIENEELRKKYNGASGSLKELEEKIGKKLGTDGTCYRFAPLGTEGLSTEQKAQLEADKIWYSYDTVWRNFHIVPDIKAAEKYKDDCAALLNEVGNALEGIAQKHPESDFSDIKYWNRRGDPKEECTKTHLYKYITVGEMQYLISFNRLWVSVNGNTKTIHNDIGMCQFMAYPIQQSDGNINKGVDDADFPFYPASNGDWDRISVDGRSVFNAPFRLCSAPDAERIAECFYCFILFHKATPGKA